MRRHGLTALVLFMLSSAVSARAATFLYLRGEPADWIGQIAASPRWLEAPNATIVAFQPYPGTFAFQINRADVFEFWSVYWSTTFGGAFAPGTYEIPNFLQVSGNGQGCSGYTGRVVVHEVVIEGSEVKSVSLDFEQHCDGATGGLFGSLRYHTGDLACAGADDGTSCDDGDACTPSSSCLAGSCVSTDARPSCPPDRACTVEAPCDPANGLCPASPVAPPGGLCDDGDACTLYDRCAEGGACVGELRDCDDQSPCTTDSCDAATGCVYTPVAEQCWAIASRSFAHLTASGTVRGHHVRCSGACTSGSLQLLLIDGDRYRIPSGTSECLDGEPFDGADETGTLVPARRGRTTFTLDNLDQLQDDVLFCTGARLKSIQRVMSVAPGASTLTGVERVRTKLPEQIPTRLTIKSVFNGAPFEVDEPPDFPGFPPGRRPPDCGSGFHVHCKVD
jgi:hypothetical protein